MTKPVGGEFAGAWESLAAASSKRRAPRGEFASYSTAELVRDASSAECDDATRKKLNAEISRRLDRKYNRKSGK